MSNIFSIVKLNLRDLMRRKKQDSSFESDYQDQLKIAKRSERKTYEEYKDK